MILLYLSMCDLTVDHNSGSGIARSKSDFLTRTVISMN